MARKKGGHSGWHGWFVTFADLMALLMSTFVMLVALALKRLPPRRCSEW